MDSGRQYRPAGDSRIRPPGLGAMLDARHRDQRGSSDGARGPRSLWKSLLMESGNVVEAAATNPFV